MLMSPLCWAEQAWVERYLAGVNSAVSTPGTWLILIFLPVDLAE